MQRIANPYYVGSIPALASNSLASTVAQVAKLVDARDLKSLGGNPVPVRFRPWAPTPRKVTAQICLALAALTLSPAVLGAGSFALPFDSVAGAARAFTGVETDPASPDAITRSPSALAWTESRQATLGGTLAYYRTAFRGQATRSGTDDSPIPGGNGGNPGRLDLPLPVFSMALPLTDRLVLGASLTAPYGITLRYDEGWTGRYHALDTLIRGVELTSGAAWRVNEQWAVGAGLRGQLFVAEFSNDVDLGAVIQRRAERQAGGADVITPSCTLSGEAPLPGKYDFRNVLDDSRLALGWLASVTWQPSDRWRASLAYRSAITHDLAGDASRFRAGWTPEALRNDGCFNGLRVGLAAMGRSFEEEVVQPALRASAHTGFRSRFVLPETITGGLRGDWGAWTVTGTVRWTRWSRFDALTLRFDNGAPTVTEPLRFRDSALLGVGVEHATPSRWTLRGGLAHETATVDRRNRTARAPDAARSYLTGGVGFRWSPALRLDISAGLMRGPARPVIDLTEASDSGNRLNGRFEPLLLAFGAASLTWSF